MVKNILFVCTGNTDRSPLAEYAFREIAKNEGATGIEIRSAGTSVGKDIPNGMSGNSKFVLQKKLNVPEEVTSKHTSRQLTKELVDWADLIVPMTESHKMNVIRLIPNIDRSKVRKLMTFANSNTDVSDPFGMNVDAYFRTYDLILPALKSLAKQVKLGNFIDMQQQEVNNTVLPSKINLKVPEKKDIDWADFDDKYDDNI